MEFTSRKALAVTALCLIAALTPRAYGQERFGQITGVATDPTGAAVPNAKACVGPCSSMMGAHI